MPRHLLWLAALAMACEAETPPSDISVDEPTGELQYAIGSDVRAIPYGEVRCAPDGDATMVQLVSHRVVRGPQGVGQRPRVLVARLRADEVLEAHAFAYGVSHGGTAYTMLQFVAAEVAGAEEADCRLERTGDTTTLACNETTVVGWTGAGEPPRPSFKATWETCT